MFRAKTLLVLGAGASAEVDLPIGSQLLAEVVKLADLKFDLNRRLTGDSYIVDGLTLAIKSNRFEDVFPFVNAASQLVASAGQALSIDNVIDALEDDRVELVGKLSIVRAIHEAERQSRVAEGGGRFGDPYLRRFAGTWYDSFTKLLTENVRKSEVSSIFNNLEIINFNYDRCVENYLPISLASYYGLPPQEAQGLVSELVMHRPYGVAGRLPWQPRALPAVEFGGGRPEQTAEAALQIKTFTERVEEGEVLARIKNAVATAERVVFLGFAFHRQNLSLLNAELNTEVEVVATGFGISGSDRGVITNELRRTFEGFSNQKGQNRQVHIPSYKCAQLFEEYWRTLTAEPSA